MFLLKLANRNDIIEINHKISPNTECKRLVIWYLIKNEAKLTRSAIANKN
jgi:hypothetical protein